MMKEMMKKKVFKWVLGLIISNLVFILGFFFIIMIIVSIAGGIGGGSSMVSACNSSSDTEKGEQPGAGTQIPSSEIQNVKIAFRDLPNWDGKTRALPVNNGYVSSDFNTTDSAHSIPHNGTDYASTGNLFALVDGVVVAGGLNSERGNMIAVAFKGTDGTAYTYLYQHLASKPKKQVGEKVKMGDVLGTAGNTGKSGGVHLHVEVEIASMRDEVPRWVGTYPTNPKVMFDTVKFFQLPKTIKGNEGNNISGDRGSGEAGNRCSKGRVITNLEGNENAEKAFNFFIQQGFSKEGASGIVGNLMVESSMNPKAGENSSGGGRGIAQWGQGGTSSNGASAGTRWKKLDDWAKSQNMNPDELVTQLNFIIVEMKEYGIFDYFKNINVLYTAPTKTEVYGGGAVGYFAEKFEKPSVADAHMDRRNSYAVDAMAKWGK